MSDEELRRQYRLVKANNSVEDETQYLAMLLRAGQVTEKQIILASYMGHPAAEALLPWDTPYKIASLMGMPPPKPPQTSWFCHPLEPPLDDPNDVAHLWVDNLRSVGSTSIVRVM